MPDSVCVWLTKRAVMRDVPPSSKMGSWMPTRSRSRSRRHGNQTSARYGRRSMIATFSAWAEIRSARVAVSASIGYLIHHAEVIILKGDGHRPLGMEEEVLTGKATRSWVCRKSRPAVPTQVSTGVDTTVRALGGGPPGVASQRESGPSW